MSRKLDLHAFVHTNAYLNRQKLVNSLHKAWEKKRSCASFILSPDIFIIFSSQYMFLYTLYNLYERLGTGHNLFVGQEGQWYILFQAWKYPPLHSQEKRMANSVFPTSWKIADVIPIHKGRPYDDPNNYRPVSTLPVLSKIIERHVAKSLLAHLLENNLIYKAQSGFRPNREFKIPGRLTTRTADRK